jgi:hypothetical protein
MVPGKVNVMNRAFVSGLVVSIFIGMALSATPARAQLMRSQMMCGKRIDMVRQLGEKYGESRRSMGLAGRRRVIELFASEVTGSWTILLTSPQGTACLMAAGEAFQVEPVRAVGSPT